MRSLILIENNNSTNNTVQNNKDKMRTRHMQSIPPWMAKLKKMKTPPVPRDKWKLYKNDLVSSVFWCFCSLCLCLCLCPTITVCLRCVCLPVYVTVYICCAYLLFSMSVCVSTLPVYLSIEIMFAYVSYIPIYVTDCFTCVCV